MYTIECNRNITRSRRVTATLEARMQQATAEMIPLADPEKWILMNSYLEKFTQGVQKVEFLALVSDYILTIKLERAALKQENGVLQNTLENVRDQMFRAEEKIATMEENQRNFEFYREFFRYDAVLSGDIDFEAAIGCCVNEKEEVSLRDNSVGENLLTCSNSDPQLEEEEKDTLAKSLPCFNCREYLKEKKLKQSTDDLHKETAELTQSLTIFNQENNVLRDEIENLHSMMMQAEETIATMEKELKNLEITRESALFGDIYGDTPIHHCVEDQHQMPGNDLEDDEKTESQTELDLFDNLITRPNPDHTDDGKLECGNDKLTHKSPSHETSFRIKMTHFAKYLINFILFIYWYIFANTHSYIVYIMLYMLIVYTQHTLDHKFIDNVTKSNNTKPIWNKTIINI